MLAENYIATCYNTPETIFDMKLQYEPDIYPKSYSDFNHTNSQYISRRSTPCTKHSLEKTAHNNTANLTL